MYIYIYIYYIYTHTSPCNGPDRLDLSKTLVTLSMTIVLIVETVCSRWSDRSLRTELVARIYRWRVSLRNTECAWTEANRWIA